MLDLVSSWCHATWCWCQEELELVLVLVLSSARAGAGLASACAGASFWRKLVYVGDGASAGKTTGRVGDGAGRTLPPSHWIGLNQSQHVALSSKCVLL